MAQRALFKKCVRCGGKIPLTDGHSQCLYCLGESHSPSACQLCQRFSSQALKNRRHRLNNYLWEKSLLPPTMSSEGAPSVNPAEKPPKCKSKSKKSGSTESSKPKRPKQASVPTAVSPPRQQPSVSSPQLSPNRRSPSPASAYSSEAFTLSSRQNSREDLTDLFSNAGQLESVPQPPVPSSYQPFAGPFWPGTMPPPSVPFQGAMPSMPPPSVPSNGNKKAKAKRRKSSAALPLPAEKRPCVESDRGREKHSPPVLPADRSTPSRRPKSTKPKHSYAPAASVPLPPASGASPSSQWSIPSYQMYAGMTGFPPGPWSSHPFGPPACSSVPNQPVHMGPPFMTPFWSYPPFPYPPPVQGESSVPTHHGTVPPAAAVVGKRASKSARPSPSSPLESDPSSSSDPSDSEHEDDIVTGDVTTPDSDVGDVGPLSASDSIANYSEFISRMASTLNVPTHYPTPQYSDHLFDQISSESSSPIHLGILPSILEMAKDSFQKIPSASKSRKLEGLYRVYDEKASYLLKHPIPNSVVVSASQLLSKSKEVPIPPSKEGRKIDSMGRQLYSSAALSFKIANYQAVMGAYQRALLSKLKPILDSLPDESASEASKVLDEALTVAAQQMRSGRHASDAATKSMGSAIAFRRHAWLRATSLGEGTKAKIEALPFEGEGLFHTKTDELMNEIQKGQNTAKRLSLVPRKQGRSFRPSWKKQYPQPFPRQQPKEPSYGGPAVSTYPSKDKAAKPRFKSSRHMDKGGRREF